MIKVLDVISMDLQQGPIGDPLEPLVGQQGHHVGQQGLLWGSMIIGLVDQQEILKNKHLVGASQEQQGRQVLLVCRQGHRWTNIASSGSVGTSIEVKGASSGSVDASRRSVGASSDSIELEASWPLGISMHHFGARMSLQGVSMNIWWISRSLSKEQYLSIQQKPLADQQGPLLGTSNPY